ncbi:MAG: DNA translocase FtsK, partial [Pseudomonadota bacterium]
MPRPINETPSPSIAADTRAAARPMENTTTLGTTTPELTTRFKSLKDSLAQHSQSSLVTFKALSWPKSSDKAPAQFGTEDLDVPRILHRSSQPGEKGNTQSPLATPPSADIAKDAKHPVRDEAFDHATEAASLAIARRFAPARLFEDHQESGVEELPLTPADDHAPGAQSDTRATQRFEQTSLGTAADVPLEPSSPRPPVEARQAAVSSSSPSAPDTYSGVAAAAPQDQRPTLPAAIEQTATPRPNLTTPTPIKTRSAQPPHGSHNTIPRVQNPSDERQHALQRFSSPSRPMTADQGNAPQPHSGPALSAPAQTPQQTPSKARATAPPSRARSAFLKGFKSQKKRGYQKPSLNLLNQAPTRRGSAKSAQANLNENAAKLTQVLKDFGIKGEVRGIEPGPVVTLYEFEPARGIKASRIIGLADDIARSMSALSARVGVIPGRNLIGIELPNGERQTVFLREIIEADAFRSMEGGLPLVLGKSIGGQPIVDDLATMPHLLVAGTTGSGKSVGVNAMILSLLYRFEPQDCRFLMIDPKMLELSVYNGIPHLLAPVVTDPNEAVGVLSWVVNEMEERYKRMAQLSVRNIDVFNNRVRNAKKRGETIARMVQTGFDKHTGQAMFEQQSISVESMPRIVVVIDEFADLMMVAGKEVEARVQRLAQMARAAGIHLIMSTQRPSVDVITGTIKANFPTRISFKVASKIDSRTILN